MTLESARLAGSSPRGEIASGRAAQQEKLCLRRGGVIATAIARWLDTVERTRYIAEHAVRQDPVLPRDVIGMSWTTGAKGLCPRTRISWMMKMEGNGAWPSLTSMAMALPWNGRRVGSSE